MPELESSVPASSLRRPPLPCRALPASKPDCRSSRDSAKASVGTTFLNASASMWNHFITAKTKLLSGPFLASLILALVVSPAFAQSSNTSSIQSNFNGTSIAGGDYIWFSAVFKPTTPISTTTTTDIYFQNQTISFTAGGVNYNLSVPNSQITFSPSATTATTVFNTSTNTWVTTVPANANLPGNAFLSGFALPVPAGGLAGGINPVTWAGTFSSDQSGVGLNWQWAAANYTSFNSNYSTLGIKPVDSNNLSSYLNSDNAGSPENYANYVTGGARGGGGSNYTGSLSATTSPLIQGMGHLTIITQESPNLQTRSDTAYHVQASYTAPSPLIDKLYLTRTWQIRSAGNVFGQSTQDTNSPYTYSVPLLGIAVNQDLGNFSPLVQYGLETWTLSYAPTDGSSPPVVLDIKQVLIYPKSTATISDALNLGTNPTSLASTYQGDTPRVKIEIDKSYPGGTTYAVFFPGTVRPASLQPISSYTTPASDINPQRIFYFDVGTSVNGSGTYTVQVIQTGTAYGANGPDSAETPLATATFTINPNFQITSEVGLTK